MVLVVAFASVIGWLFFGWFASFFFAVVVAWFRFFATPPRNQPHCKKHNPTPRRMVACWGLVYFYPDRQRDLRSQNKIP